MVDVVVKGICRTLPAMSRARLHESAMVRRDAHHTTKRDKGPMECCGARDIAQSLEIESTLFLLRIL